MRLDLAPTLPPVLADSNQILHVCLHLAGQIGAQLGREAQSTLFVRTHSQGNFVLVDFLSYDPSGDPALQSVSFQSALDSEGGNKPATLSLSACSPHRRRTRRPSLAAFHSRSPRFPDGTAGRGKLCYRLLARSEPTGPQHAAVRKLQFQRFKVSEFQR